MARRGKGLTARKVETAGPGKYEDGRGLRLVVSPSGAANGSSALCAPASALKWGSARPLT
jgi:hypothetical protein